MTLALSLDLLDEWQKMTPEAQRAAMVFIRELSTQPRDEGGAITGAWTIRPDIPDAERTVESLAHEWNVVGAKMRYDLECLGPERGDDESNAVMNPASERRDEIEGEILERTLASLAECEAVARLIRGDREECGGEVNDAMLDLLVLGITNMATIAKGGSTAEATVAMLDDIEKRRLAKARGEPTIY